MTCLNCSKTYKGGFFPSKTTKFCSRSCVSKSYESNFIYKKCITCGIDFKIKPYGRSKGKYCGLKCIRYVGNKSFLGVNKGKGFWQIATEEQKKERIKSEFDRLVIKQDGCWKWGRVPLQNGYGTISMGRSKTLLAHRASWEINFGEIPKSHYVCHKCDNPICTNPDHLFIGTAKDNTRDCLNKKRKNAPSGINHHNVKLTEEQVGEIKELIILKYSQRILAKMYNVSPSTIQNIVDNKTWKNLQ